ncbi:MAG: DNA topoisomerase [Pirellulales bacterium]
MQAAQALYETGHITYMRTDSTTLSKEALTAAREVVTNLFGSDYLPDAPRVYENKVKNAQEAHEAIRPAGHPFATPQSLRAELNDDQYKLYDLIWKRTVACQMKDAKARRLTVEIKAEDALFQANGKTIDFPGYLRAYVEGSDDPSAVLADQESVLPPMQIDDQLGCEQLEGKSHTTQPPARYTEASLTRTLEELGIGRPSTYASIIDTIQAREYALKRGNALVPTWIAFSVAKLMENHLPDLVDYQFTARMEDDLDAISRGEAESVAYLKQFYFGNGRPGLKQQLDNKFDEVDPREISRVLIGHIDNDGTPEPVFARVGRPGSGPFLEWGERYASIPDGTAPDEITIDKARELFEQAAKADEPLGRCPETGKPVFLKSGRFGPYVQRGTPNDEEKPKNASLLKGMTPEDVDLETALKLLSLPRELGPDPKSGDTVTAYNGRFGPYVKCGDETRSLPSDVSPLDVTLEQALQLLAQPKKARRGFGQAREPIKVFDESPVTKQKVQLLDGRYGPYVTDGETNASVPKGTAVDQLSFEDALNLLAARATQGGTKKKGAKKPTAKKATKKATTKKKATKKKSSTKK